MPSPVASWVDNTPLTAKSLNLALYTSDGTADNPNGIAFHAQRPLLFEAYNRSLTVPGSVAGTRSTLASSGTITSCWVIMDTAGFFGQTSDLPGKGYYQFKPVIYGGLGDGVTPGGWHIISHFAPISSKSTLTAVGADLYQDGVFYLSGTRQAAATNHDNCAFFIDLVNVGTHQWAPSVRIDDSSSASSALKVNVTDSSGETPRFVTIWAAIAGTSSGNESWTTAGTYSFTAPAGVTSVTASVIGAGGGGGGGNPNYGGGGAGGGEYAQQVINVTPGNNYTVNVGAGGLGGAAGVSGSAGGISTFAGDTASVTAHGGSGGGSAATNANGVGGAGGTGSTNTTHFNGGAGVTGATGNYGGGGGSSAGSSSSGNKASGSTGGVAPAGGGPGGDGGQAVIGIVQYASVEQDKNKTTKLSLNSAIQAGNGLVVCVYTNGNASYSSAPVLTLSDGTIMSQQISETTNGGNYSFITGIYTAFGLNGGQTSVTINSNSGSDQINLAQAWEVSGLGSSPNIDTSNSTSSQSSSYSISSSSSGVPDIWIGTVGAQRLSGFTVNSPGSSWTSPTQIPGTFEDKVYGRLRSGYHIATSSGTMKYSGSFSTSGSWQAMIIAITALPNTSGNSPASPSGGGGGGAFDANQGGTGSDGSVALTWTSLSNTNFGTPDLPAPMSSWDAGMTVDAALLNGSTGVRDVINYLSNPPIFRDNSVTGQSIPNTTNTVVSLNASPDADTYVGWNSATNTYTIQRNGLYLIGGLVAYSANGTGYRVTGVSVNGTIYWGPGYSGTSVDEVIAAKTQIFSLIAGDTVQLYTRQNSGGALSLSTADQTRMFIVWLSKAGVPFQSWTPPDISYRWKSGTDFNDLPALMSTYLSNDLGFLVQRPYLLSYQASAQTGFTASGGIAAAFVNRIATGTMNSGTSTIFTASVTKATSGNGTLLVTIGFGNQDGNVTSVSDSKGNTYVNDYAANTTTTGGRGLEVWHCTNFTALTTSDTITVTLSTAQLHGAALICDQFTGLSTTDVQAMNYAGTGTTTNSVSITATASDQIVFSANCIDSPSSSPTVSSPFTATGSDVSSVVGSVGLDLLTSYAAAPSGGGALTATYNWTGSSTDVAIAVGYPAPTSSNGFYTVTMDTIAGIVHGDVGDNYSGWSSGPSNNYAAPVDGWYLVCGEMFATSSSATGAAVVGAIQTASSGGFAPSQMPDWYQNNPTTNTAAVGGGAAIFGVYYLNAGEVITPQIMGSSYGATYGTLAGTSLNGGTVASHMEIVWISE